MRKVDRLFSCLLLALAATRGAPAADFAWAKGMGGTIRDVAWGVAVDSNGNVYAVGNFQGTADFDPGPDTYNLTSDGTYDVFLSKLDSAGTFVWAKHMGGGDEPYPRGVSVDSDGNVYTVGNFQGTADFDPGPLTYNLTSAGAYDVFVSKLDSAGTFVWAKCMGGTFDDIAWDVAMDSSGNVYTVGYFLSGTGDFDPGPGTYSLTSAGAYDVFISKLDGAGNFVWAKRMGGNSYDAALGVAVEAMGTIYIAGYFQDTVDFDPGPGTHSLTSAGAYDAFISKLDSAGDLVWAKRMGGTLSDITEGVAVNSSGSVYTAGVFEGAADFDPGPGTYNLTSTSAYDAFISKLDSAGNFVWAGRMGGTSNDVPTRMALDDNGNVYTVGYFQQGSTADFDPGPGTYNLTSAGANDAFISKLDSAGNFVWAGRMGGTLDEIAWDVAMGDSGSVYTAGYFQSTADFGAYNLTSAGSNDAFISKLRSCDSFFVEQRGYGSLLFPLLCTRNASGLKQDVYNSRSFGVFRGSNDRFFLSSEGKQFSPLVVDEAVHMNGTGTGLGPYVYQPGVPPVLYDVPIEQNLVPLPAHEVTSLIPVGGSSVLFEVLDTHRAIYGNTAVYLIRDCGIWLAGRSPTSINWVTRDDQVAGTPPEFDVRYGHLSHLRADGNFSRASCLGRFHNTPAPETLPNPPVEDGYYYLARGLSSCVAQGYGDSSLVPDPRDALDALPACP